MLATTAEGGLNDGTALPIVMRALGLIGSGDLAEHGLGCAWRGLAWPTLGGATLGWLFGRGLGSTVHRLLRHGHGLGRNRRHQRVQARRPATP